MKPTGSPGNGMSLPFISEIRAKVNAKLFPPKRKCDYCYTLTREDKIEKWYQSPKYGFYMYKHQKHESDILSELCERCVKIHIEKAPRIPEECEAYVFARKWIG